MRKWLVLLAVFCVAFAVPAGAEVVIDEQAEGEIGVSPISPIRTGHLEINPIMSFRMSSGTTVYQVGASLGYAITRHHQGGGAFVMGNKLYSRTNQRQVVRLDDVRIDGAATRFSVDQGFGSSFTGFYRFNLPFEVSRRTYPHVEVFAGRDFGWGSRSEAGAGVGFRRFINRTTALTSQYSYVVLFADGENFNRHIISAGFTVFMN